MNDLIILWMGTSLVLAISCVYEFIIVPIIDGKIHHNWVSLRYGIMNKKRITKPLNKATEK